MESSGAVREQQGQKLQGSSSSLLCNGLHDRQRLDTLDIE